MEAEATRLAQMERHMSQVLKTQEKLLEDQAQSQRNHEALEARIRAMEGNHPNTQLTGQQPKLSSYAKAVGTPITAHPQAPAISPPTRPVLKSLKPGKAIIHSDPTQSEIQRAESGFLVQRANEVLLRLDAKVNGENISIRGAQVLKSGDVCFFSANKNHQRWLMDNKHIWTKDVHPHLAATPSTYSIIAHGVPKSFNPTAPSSVSKISVENNIRDGDLIRIKWLADNSESAKQAGSIVLTFINKETAHRCERSGIFLNYNYHRTANFKPRPPQCYKCLKMGHFGQWCREKARCGKCGDEHVTKDCPEGLGGIRACVLCQEAIKMKMEGVESTDHTPFNVSCFFKRTWLEKRNIPLK
jgi:hypothetical protein